LIGHHEVRLCNARRRQTYCDGNRRRPALCTAIMVAGDGTVSIGEIPTLCNAFAFARALSEMVCTCVSGCRRPRALQCDVNCKLSAGPDFKLAVNTREVGLDRLGADERGGTDLAIAHALRNEFGDALLADC
jgi:hypothetical protein